MTIGTADKPFEPCPRSPPTPSSILVFFFFSSFSFSLQGRAARLPGPSYADGLLEGQGQGTPTDNQARLHASTWRMSQPQRGERGRSNKHTKKKKRRKRRKKKKNTFETPRRSEVMWGGLRCPHPTSNDFYVLSEGDHAGISYQRKGLWCQTLGLRDVSSSTSSILGSSPGSSCFEIVRR